MLLSILKFENTMNFLDSLNFLRYFNLLFSHEPKKKKDYAWNVAGNKDDKTIEFHNASLKDVDTAVKKAREDFKEFSQVCVSFFSVHVCLFSNLFLFFFFLFLDAKKESCRIFGSLQKTNGKS